MRILANTVHHIIVSAWVCGVFLALVVNTAFAEKRVAFIVGINSYKNIPRLENPVIDANAIADLLQENGFIVFRSIDPDKARFSTDLKIFSDAAIGADEAFIYYAGHGLAAIHEGKFSNVLAPIDASLSCERREASNVITISELVASVKSVPKRVFVFDACRDNPFDQCGATENSRTLGFSQQPLSSFVQQSSEEYGDKKLGSSLLVFSTDLGSVALDGSPGENSPFALAMLKKLRISARNTMRSIFAATSKEVAEQSGYSQVPWVTSIGGDPNMCLAGENCDILESLSSQVMLGRSNRLAEEAEKLAKSGYARKAIALTLEALPNNRDKPDRPYLGRAEKILRTAMRSALPVLANDVEKNNSNSRLLAVSPNRVHVATLLGWKSIVIRDIVSNVIVSRLVISSGRFHDVSFSPNGKHVLSREESGLLRVWEISSGTSLYQQQDQQYSGHIVWSRSGNTAFISTEITREIAYEVSETKTKVWSWAIKDGRIRVLAKFGKIPNIDQLAINGKKDHLIFSYTKRGANDNREFRIRGVRIKGFRKVFDREIGSGTINAITVSPDFNSMLLASGDSVARLVRAQDGKTIYTLRGHESSYSGLDIAKFSPDSKWMMTAGHDGVVRAWDISTGQRRWSYMSGSTGKALQLKVDKGIASADWSPDGRTIVVSTGEVVTLWDVVSNASVPTIAATIRNEKRPIESKGADYIGTVSFGPNGSKLITSINGTTLFDVSQFSNQNGDAKGRELLRIKPGSGAVGNMELLPDGNTLYVASIGNYADGGVIDLKSGKILQKFRQAGGRAIGASTNVSLDGKLAISVTNLTYIKPGTNDKYSDQHIVATNLQTGKIVWKQRTKPYHPTVATISPDNRTIAVAMLADGTSDKKTIFAIHLWHIGQSQSFGELRGHTNHVTGLVFTHDGKGLISTSQDETTRLWDLQTQKETKLLSGTSDAVGRNALSFDGRYFATAKRRFRIWDLKSGKMVKDLPYKSGSVHLSRDGKLALLVGDFKPLRLLDLESGEIILEPEPSNIVLGAILAPDSSRLIYALADGHIIVRALENNSTNIIEQACELGPVLLSKVEREVLRLPIVADKPICAQPGANNQ